MESEDFSSVFISLFSGGRKSFSPDEMLHDFVILDLTSEKKDFVRRKKKLSKKTVFHINKKIMWDSVRTEVLWFCGSDCCVVVSRLTRWLTEILHQHHQGRFCQKKFWSHTLCFSPGKISRYFISVEKISWLVYSDKMSVTWMSFSW